VGFIFLMGALEYRFFVIAQRSNPLAIITKCDKIASSCLLAITSGDRKCQGLNQFLYFYQTPKMKTLLILAILFIIILMLARLKKFPF
jgi:hypothetical protein